MKYFYTITFLMFITLCNEQLKSVTFETELNKKIKEKEYKSNGSITQQDSLSISFKPDVEIEEISLLCTENINKYLEEDIMNSLTNSAIPFVSVLSSDLKQELIIYFHPGNISIKFSEFEVSKNVDNNPKNANNKIIASEEFITESGIKLGITTELLKSIKGKPESTINQKTTILKYRIDNFKNSTFLQK